MFLSHKSSLFFPAKFDDRIYPFARRKGLYDTLRDPRTSSDPVKVMPNVPRIAPEVILAHVGLFLLNNADSECGASKLKTGL